MQREETEDSGEMFFVVVNAEEQYSIWRANKPLPKGWSAVGPSRTKQECLTHIESVWTDMRPLSLRKRMASPASESGSPQLS